VDEAQNIKNPAAKQTQAIRKFNAEFSHRFDRYACGKYRLSELWSIMHFLNPGYLGGRTQFRADFALPIERYHDEAALKQLKQLTMPFIFAPRQNRPARDLGPA